MGDRIAQLIVEKVKTPDVLKKQIVKGIPDGEMKAIVAPGLIQINCSQFKR